MKRELTLTDIAGYLPHNIKGMFNNGEIWGIDVLSDEICYDNRVLPLFHFTSMKLILRPMSDLFVKITERGYNDGKPFIPIFMMAKIKYPEFTHFTHCDLDSGTVFMSSPQSPAAWYEYDEEKLSIGEYDLLHRLHLDYRGLIPAGLAVSVYDLLTNPYEA